MKIAFQMTEDLRKKHHIVTTAVRHENASQESLDLTCLKSIVLIIAKFIRKK